MTPVYSYESHEYLAGCRYRLDTYRCGQRTLVELHDLQSLDEHGFSQVIFEGHRRSDAMLVVGAIEGMKEAG